jgi:hypothetical protein
MLALAACGDTGASTDTDQRGSTTSSSTDVAETSELDGPVMRYPRRSSETVGMAAEVSGVLQLEGPCLYAVSGTPGERYPVLWPAGTRWDEVHKSVVPPSGEPMPIGSRVYGCGGYLYLRDVERLAGPEASALASTCVANKYSEIAVVNNADTAIGLTHG